MGRITWTSLCSGASRYWLLALPLAIGIAAFGWAQWPNFVAAAVEAPAQVDLGRHENNKLVLTSVEIRNAGRRPLELTRFRGSCPSCLAFGLASPAGPEEVGEVTLKPGESVSLTVRLLIHGTPDRPFRAAIAFDTNDPRRQEMEIVFEAEVFGSIFASPPELDIGTLEPGQKVRRTIEIRDSGRGSPCQISRALSPEPTRVQVDVTGAISPVGNTDVGQNKRLVGTLEVVITAPATAWDLIGQITVIEVGNDHPLVVIPVRVRVLPAAKASPASVVLPRVVADAYVFDADCSLSSSSGKPILVTPVDIPAEVTATRVVDRDDGMDRVCYRLSWRPDHRPPKGESRTATVRFRIESGNSTEVVEVPVRCRIPD